VRFGNEWRKRKRGCMEIIDMICESADMNRKDFIVRVQHFLYFNIEKDWY
jgi:hypothetical protein